MLRVAEGPANVLTISKSKANLSGGERHPLRIGLEEPPKVHEQPLRRLGSQVSDGRALGSDARLEHEVERERRAEGLAARGSASVLLELLVELRGRERVGLDLYAQVPLPLLRGHVGLLLDELVDRVLEQLVRPEALAAHGVLDHEVGEAVDVAGGLEDDLRREAGALHLEHRLGQDEVLPPDVDHGRLERARGRPEVEQPLHAAVYLEARDDEHLAQNELIERLAVELLRRVELLLLLAERLGLQFERLEGLDGRTDFVGIRRRGLFQGSHVRPLLRYLGIEGVDVVLQGGRLG